MRDLLAAAAERVLVYDGGMGATLEQFDLSLERDYRLEGRCHEALVLNRPDVIEGVHTSMLDAGAEVIETDTFQGSRLKLSEWGLGALEALEVDIIGLNCSTGPEDMRDAIRFLGETSSRPVHCIPNAGLPLQGRNGETIFPEQPEPLANVLGEFVERYSVSIVGGCCGTTPKHIEAIAERVNGRAPASRPAARPPHLSSMMTAAALVQ